MYEIAIVGSGPAGVSAALTLHALKKNFIWFGKNTLSEKIYKAEQIQNYPGLNTVTGRDMQRAFLAQIQDLGLTITEKTVTGVYKMKSHYVLACDKETFEAKDLAAAKEWAINRIRGSIQRTIGYYQRLLNEIDEKAVAANENM